MNLELNYSYDFSRDFFETFSHTISKRLHLFGQETFNLIKMLQVMVKKNLFRILMG